MKIVSRFDAANQLSPRSKNASLLVNPDKIIAAVSVNNSPMAETLAHLPACVPLSVLSYQENGFAAPREDKLKANNQAAAKTGRWLILISLFRRAEPKMAIPFGPPVTVRFVSFFASGGPKDAIRSA